MALCDDSFGYWPFYKLRTIKVPLSREQERQDKKCVMHGAWTPIWPNHNKGTHEINDNKKKLHINTSQHWFP